MTNKMRRELKRLIDEKQRIRQLPELRCKGCGVEYGDRTVGCRQCMWRLRNRKHRDTARQACRGCDTDFNDLTPGCDTCNERMRTRERRLRHVNNPVENAVAA
jgi:hypothetical protein